MKSLSIHHHLIVTDLTCPYQDNIICMHVSGGDYDLLIDARRKTEILGYLLKLIPSLSVSVCVACYCIFTRERACVFAVCLRAHALMHVCACACTCLCDGGMHISY